MQCRLRPGPRKLDQIPLFLVGFGVADRKHRFSGGLALVHYPPCLVPKPHTEKSARLCCTATHSPVDDDLALDGPDPDAYCRDRFWLLRRRSAAWRPCSAQRRCVGLLGPRFSRFDLPIATLAALPASRERSQAAVGALPATGSAQRHCIGFAAPRFSRFAHPHSPPCRRATPGAKRRRSAADQRLRKQVGLMVPVAGFDVHGDHQWQGPQPSVPAYCASAARKAVVLTVVVGDDELREIARAGYVEAASTNRKDREAAVTLFLSDAVWGLMQ